MYGVIKVHNDHKGKDQSFTATLDFNQVSCFRYFFDGFRVEAWGSTEAEAIEGLRAAVDDLVKSFGCPVDFTKVEYVDWKGDPIGK